MCRRRGGICMLKRCFLNIRLNFVLFVFFLPAFLIATSVGLQAKTAAVEQATKSIFHSARSGGKDVGFYGGQMDDVLANEAFGDEKSPFVNLVQAQKIFGQVAHRIIDVDPFLTLIQMNIAQVVVLNNVDLLVLRLT